MKKLKSSDEMIFLNPPNVEKYFFVIFIFYKIPKRFLPERKLYTHRI